ncbi:DUF4349 domain-containing protein [Alteribacter natronophilus]|uniref:DUF4349 domain-containing protein n=1 Tax=Alteribacter natronophilus TaxID=2583810 RepID=UPI00110F29AA|nr:DUF4349 domain-containing protein [Alteribacter natronophilus]TMW69888.1 DUF4349 domain-containing protein [Alteribacter natronophilus]
MKIVLALVTMLIILAACSNSEDRADEAQDDAGGFEDTVTESGDSGGSGYSEVEEAALETDGGAEPSELPAQMVIYNGSLTIETADYDDTYRSIQDDINSRGGFIVETNVSQHGENENRTGNLTVRIPQAEFFPFMDRIEAGSSRVIDKSAHGSDVTEEYVDLESRLRSKETVEERLLSFMDEAEDTENLLRISNDLASVQEEIEQLKGRMNYLEDHTAFSTVTVHILERTVRVDTLQDRENLNTLERAQSLFMNTVNVIISALSGLVVFAVGLSPVLIPLIAVGVILFFRRKKRPDTPA